MHSLIDYTPLYWKLKDRLQPLAAALPDIITANFNSERWGNLPGWIQALHELPDIPAGTVTLDSPAITLHSNNPIAAEILQQLEDGLKKMHPWRKGPFNIHGIHIDTEWRSDWKWDRLAHAVDLHGKTVLDVGCGSGYHCWRMRGAGAELVLGIDTSPLFVCQYHALQKYIKSDSVFVIPAGIEDIPGNLQAFDAVFSMGVLYHRRSPMEHLLELRQLLKPGGELVLETLVIDGNEHTALLPADRYGRMGNVWFIPSTAALAVWLEKNRFTDVKLIDVNTTTTTEQRTTEWMTFQSLADFLDPGDPTKTIEGYPAPKRAIFTARAPLS